MTVHAAGVTSALLFADIAKPNSVQRLLANSTVNDELEWTAKCRNAGFSRIALSELKLVKATPPQNGIYLSSSSSTKPSLLAVSRDFCDFDFLPSFS